MEIFRRLGVAAAIRAGGLPDDYPHDVAYRTAATGIELTRITIPAAPGANADAVVPVAAPRTV